MPTQAAPSSARPAGRAPVGDIPAPKIEYLKLSRLSIDHVVQRERIKITRAQKIADELDVNALGVLTISRRADGTERIIDGMHRHRACDLADRLDLTVKCDVYEGLTKAQEAKLFRLLNNAEPPSKLDIFRTRVVEGDPTAVSINRMLGRHGWKVASGTGEGFINAVQAVERCWVKDRFALERAITTVTAAWGRDPGSADGRIIEGLTLVYTRYGDAADVNEMATAIAKHGTPATLIGKARTLAQLLQTQQPIAMAETLVGIFNKKRRKFPLPEWRS